jgi:uncharacterized membrane protein
MSGQVSHGLLWANLSFLFILSLIPFGTAWVGNAVLLHSRCRFI